jgi:hypothetical protein
MISQSANMNDMPNSLIAASKHEFARLMKETRRKIDIENLAPGFRPVAGDPVYRVECYLCGKTYRLNMQSAHMSHAARHRVCDRITERLMPGSEWFVKVRFHWRKVEIVRKGARGWLVRQQPNHARRCWWIKNPERFFDVE